MTTAEAKKLRVGDPVIWGTDKNDRGEVVETGYCAVKIKWEDGQLGVIDVRDCQEVNRA